MAREKVPQNIADELMFLNRHTCCICNEPKHVQIHHIDENHNNNEIQNLAVLCLDHHSRVTGKEGLGRNYTQNEIKKYKANWEAICKNKNEEERETQDIGDYETVLFGPKEFNYYSYSLNPRDRVLVKVDSEKEVSVYLVEESELEEYQDDDDYEFQYLESQEDDTEIEFEYEIEEKENYSVVIINESRKTFYSDVDITIIENGG